MKKKLLALLMGTSLILAACGGGEDENAGNESGNGDQDTTTAGAGDAEKIYVNSCASCHGNNLEGDFGPKLNNVGSRLSQEDIEKIINEGKGSMPGGLIEGDQVSQMAKWLSEQK
ncbi:cytochrome c551 [Bacillus sp. CECT 9360]|uniref:cytochrome c551 n=1 Tax=Bacillus sp. CECT 9360 TaxID=2845821 RepID=UPI001E4A01E5|nr:cytochrome c [Bacillus sp. CECT 9360]CAH0344832.1 Cytochrome c-551 [Bacillus sp. CECT 9360]